MQQNENTPIIINRSTLSATSFRFKTNLCVDLDLTFYIKILTLKIKMQILNLNLDFNNMYDLD